jgi:PPOX class probable FMN-dependent enzyme
MSRISTTEDLEALYGTPGEASLVKVADRLTPEYRRLIQDAPFVALATVGPEGVDCSPRGELGGVVHIHDDATLMIPDRRGNNRIDSLRNIVRDARVALLFLLPGSGTTVRLNGSAHISADPDLLASFAVKGKPPRSVIVIEIAEIYTQCARAIVRADLWNPEHHFKPGALPSPGDVLAAQTANRIDGKAYDEEWPERARKSLW